MDGAEFSEMFADRIQAKRSRALVEGRMAEAARLGAMEAALRHETVPRLCPEAVKVAGDAALAAHRGSREDEWLDRAVGRSVREGKGWTELNRAVRLLKALGLWPWQ